MIANLALIPLRRFSFPRRLSARSILSAGVLVCSSLAALQSAHADKIKHPIAVFSGLDKITGRIISFEVAMDETVQFGTLQITERACYTRPATEAPQTTTFVEVDEVDAQNDYKRIFSGWMFASSPGLHAIEHPVYDIWLTDCKGGGETIANPDVTATEPTPPPPENAKPLPAKPPSKPRRVQPQAPQPPSDDFGEEPSPQNNAPIEVGPPPGFNGPRTRGPAADPSDPVPPGLVPDGRRAPSQRYAPASPPADGGF
ncbi:MAG: DUF2155 domain-containing protein [Methylocella sp.]